MGVSISHRLYIDNNTFSKIDTDRFGALYSGYHNDTGERGTQDDFGTPSIIVPDYSTAPLYLSTSIPFIGDSVWLRTVQVNLLSQ